MASGTITGSTSNQYIDSKIEWSSTQDVENNSSSVTANLYYRRNNSGYSTTGIGSFTITINGTTKTASSVSLTIGTSWVLAMTATVTVAHKDDGSKSITISATGSLPPSSLTSTNCSGTATLDTIARASVPTVSASSVAMGNKVTITTNRKSSSFTHDLTYSFGGSTGTIAAGVGTSYTWTVPDLVSKIPNATSGTCTIYCTTKNGSTTIGTKSVGVTLSVPAKSAPSVSTSTVQMGKTLTISTNRKSSSFTHTLTYSFGGATGTIATGVGASYAWTVPDLAAKIKNSTSGACTITCTTYNGSKNIGSNTVTVTLTVPGASAPTTDASSVQMGKKLVIYTNKNSPSFTHTFTYSFGSTTGTIASGIVTSTAWTVPDLAAKITNSTSGTCTITCTTYNGTAKVGEKTVSVTLTVPDASTPTTGASSVQMGKQLAIYTNKNSANFTHTFTYSFGGATGTIASGIVTATAWTVPDLVSKITNNLKGTCTITCTTYNGTAKVGSKTVAVTLTVPDASTPTTDVSTVQMGKKLVINTNKISPSFTHTFTYSFGGYSGTIASGIVTSTAWTVPDLASKITNSLSGTCTITCTTYNGTAKVGTKTVAVTLTVPDASVPTMANGYSTTAKMGDQVVIQTNSKSSSFTHTYTYAIGSYTGTIASGIKTSTKWNIPKDLASYTEKKLSASCVVTMTTYNGTAKVGSKTITMTLNVPDATVPTVSASSVSLGGNITITMPRESSAYVHDIDMTLKASGSSAVKRSESVAKNAVAPNTWTVPLDYAKDIPSATSGTITLTVTTRFAGSTQVIGSKTVSFAITVPNNKNTQPKVSISTSAVHSLGSAFAGVYVKGKTKVKLDIAASSDYSTISSYVATVDGVKYTGNPCTSNILSVNGARKITAVVTDARGYTTTVEKSITVVDYTAPKVVPYSGEKSIVCARCDSTGKLTGSGTYLKIKAGKSYATVTSGGAQKNFCTLQYRYKDGTSSSFSSWVTLLADNSRSNYVSAAPIGNVVSDVKTSYVVELRAIDDTGTYHTLSFVIPTDQIDFHLREGGKGAAFGKYSEMDDLLDIDWNLKISDGKYADITLKSAQNYRSNTDSTEENLEAWFDELLFTMPTSSAKFVEVYSSAVNNSCIMGYLYKYSDEYAAYFGISYNGTMILKRKASNVWSAAVKK